jgi:hypothetical protein
MQPTKRKQPKNHWTAKMAGELRRAHAKLEQLAIYAHAFPDYVDPRAAREVILSLGPYMSIYLGACYSDALERTRSKRSADTR